MTRRSVRWTEQPQQPTPLDFTHPLLVGLLEAVVFPDIASLMGTPRTAVGSATSFGPTSEGLAYRCTAFDNSGNSAGAYDGNGNKWARAAPLTVSLLAYIDTNSATTGNLLSSFTNNNSGWRIYFENQQIKASVAWVGGLATATDPAVTPLLTPALITMVVKAATLDLYVNGVMVNGGVAHTIGVNATNPLRFFNATGVLYGQPSGLFFGLVWGREVSAGDITILAQNPWQVFAPLLKPVALPDIEVSIARPGSDITTSAWSGSPDNVTLYTNIDEAAAVDTDYITSPGINGGQVPITFGIKDQNGSPNTLPIGTWDVKVRSKFAESPAGGQVKVTLLDSSSVSVGASAWQAVTATYATYTLSITTTGIAARILIEVQ